MIEASWHLSGEFVFVDDDIVVLNKPAGLPSHPLREGEGSSALALVVAQFPEVATASPNKLEGGLVHRLDNDTSGILVFARHPAAYTKWRALFKNNEVTKTYLALVHGKLDHKLTLDAPIAHHPKSKHKMITVADGRIYYRGKPQPAITTVTPIEVRETETLVRVTIVGGRRHQIRVHLASAGYPLVGDTLYGGPASDRFPGQALHADSITLPDGRKLEPLAWPAAFPQRLTS